VNRELSKISPHTVRAAMARRDRIVYYSERLPDGSTQVMRDVIVDGLLVAELSGPVRSLRPRA
jgi:hypothetical protein